METPRWNIQLWVTNYKEDEEEEISKNGNNSAKNMLLQKTKNTLINNN